MACSTAQRRTNRTRTSDEVQTMLREIAFVLHASRQIKEEVLADLRRIRATQGEQAAAN